MQERLQKILAHAGVASRRHAEEMIQAGRVSVNGHIITELGSKADPADVLAFARAANRDGSRSVASRVPWVWCNMHPSANA